MWFGWPFSTRRDRLLYLHQSSVTDQQLEVVFVWRSCSPLGYVKLSGAGDAWQQHLCCFSTLGLFLTQLLFYLGNKPGGCDSSVENLKRGFKCVRHLLGVHT